MVSKHRESSRESGLASAQAGSDHRVARRNANRRKARAASPTTDAQGLVAFDCECMSADCERSVRVPLYVYRRLLEAGDQYLVQAGHHAFPRNRTIVATGLMRIEERVDEDVTRRGRASTGPER